MIQIPGFPDYYVDGTDIVSMKFGKRRVMKDNVNNVGYAQVALRNKGSKPHWKLKHRLIAQAYLKDYADHLIVDHIDRDITNNHISNLRLANKSQNAQNTKRQHKGYRWHNNAKAWQARIKLNGKEINLGFFNTEDEAHAAYLAAKVIYHTHYTPEIT
jgi:hypothetical protein